MERGRGRRGSGEDPADDVATDVGETKIAAGVAEGEVFVIDAGEVQHGRVEIVHIADLIDGMDAEFVGGPVGGAAAHAAAGEKHAESLGMMIPPVGSWGVGSASELTGPEDESGIEEASLFEIQDQGGDSAVGLAGVAFVTGLESTVLIPSAIGQSVGAIHLDEAHALFDQTSGPKALACVHSCVEVWVIDSVEIPD